MATKYCPQCGAVQPEEASFCGTCGNVFPPRDQPKPAAKNLLPWISAGVVILLVIGLGGWLIIRNRETLEEAATEALPTVIAEIGGAAEETATFPATETPTPDATSFYPKDGETRDADSSTTIIVTPRNTITPEPTNTPQFTPTLGPTDTPEATPTSTLVPPLNWGDSVKRFIGSATAGSRLEISTSSGPLSERYVIIGIGGRVHGDEFTTLHVQVAPLGEGGEIDYEKQEALLFGSDPGHSLEAGTLELPEQHVVVGLGMNVGKSRGERDTNLESTVVYSRYLDPETGILSGEIVGNFGGIDPNPISLDFDCRPTVNDQTSILVGIGVTVSNNTITAAELEFGSLGNEGDTARPTPDIARINCS